MKPVENRKSKIEHFQAFTLIELLAVIAIIGVLAGLTLTVTQAAKAAQNKKVAGGELGRIELALENYKAKYGFYPPGNQNVSGATYNPLLLPQLYYELSGTVLTNISGTDYFVTLDGSSQIPANSPGNDVKQAYGVAGFVNCTKGSGEDAASARNFLPGLKPTEINTRVTNNAVQTTVLITSVGGPDDGYQPLGAFHLNPFRYVCPGTNNPGSYDLWVQLKINGKTNLICNWSRQVQVNSPLP